MYLCKKELFYRRVRKAPRLTSRQKRDRLNWCVANQNNNFENYVFTDESNIWVNEAPLYHHRHRGSYPETVGFSSGLKIKLNLWGSISCRGSSNFIVLEFQIIY